MSIMDRVRFCRFCGELLEEQWMHCPWCGKETIHGSLSWESVVDDSQGRMGRLDDISGRLNALELELDAFLAGKF